MRIYENIEKFNNCCKRSIISVGSFDGLHLGHAALLQLMKNKAHEINGETVIFTFHPHPRIVLNHVTDFKLLSTKEEKIELFKRNGINHLIIIPFTKDFAKIDFYDFVKNILVKKLDLKNLVLGYDHQFGKNREGNIENIKKLSIEFNFEIFQLSPQLINNQTISSNSIREFLQNGEIKKANELLGYSYSIYGKVVEGNKIGRNIGFPTANLTIENEYKMIPSLGVYATLTEFEGKLYKSMTNIGYRPTLNMEDVTIETNIFDFNENLYNKNMRLYFIEKIRDEQKFTDMKALKTQLHSDQLKSLKILQNAL